MQTWLDRALDQLDQINEEAAEEGYPPINDAAKNVTRDLLHSMHHSSMEPAVYPSIDGEATIYFKSPTSASAIMFMVNNACEIGFYSSIEGENSSKRYKDPSELSDEFIRDQVRMLEDMPSPVE